MHPPRPPSIDHGVVSFIWGVLLAAYIWGGLLAIGMTQVTAAILGAVCGGAIFLFVRIYGEDEPKRPRTSRRSA
jgi:hypothetical protein